MSFPIEVSDDLTLTVKKVVEETQFDTFTYYPGVLSGSSQWYGDMAFVATEEIVLTRDADQGAAAAAVKSVGRVTMPRHVTLNLEAASAADGRRTMADKMMR